MQAVLRVRAAVQWVFWSPQGEAQQGCRPAQPPIATKRLPTPRVKPETVYRLRKDLEPTRIKLNPIVPPDTSLNYVNPQVDGPTRLRHIKQSHPSSSLVSKKYNDFTAACAAWTAEKERAGKGPADILYGTSMTKAKYALIAALHDAAPDYYPPGTPGLEGRTTLGPGGRENRAASPARFSPAPNRTSTGELMVVQPHHHHHHYQQQQQELPQQAQALRAITPDPTPPTVAPSFPSTMEDDADHWSTPLPMTTTITTTTTTTTITVTPTTAPPAVRTMTPPPLSSTSVPSRRVRNIISPPPYLDMILPSSSSSSSSLTSTARPQASCIIMEFSPFWPKPPSEKEMMDGEGEDEGEDEGEGVDGGSVELITDLLLDSSTAALTEMESSWIPSTTTPSSSSSSSLPLSSSSSLVTLKCFGTSTRVTVLSGSWGTTFKRYTLYRWEACFPGGKKHCINLRYSRFKDLCKMVYSLQADESSLSSSLSSTTCTSLSSSSSSTTSNSSISSMLTLWGDVKGRVREAVGRFDKDVIERRKGEMHAFLTSVVNDPLVLKEEGVRRAMGLVEGEGEEAVGA